MSLRETLIWAWTYYGGRDPWFVLTILVEPIGGVVLLLLWLRRRPSRVMKNGLATRLRRERHLKSLDFLNVMSFRSHDFPSFSAAC